MVGRRRLKRREVARSSAVFKPQATCEANPLFVGLPPFAEDMSPQGYMGRSFSWRHPDLDLPPSINDWNDDHRLIALARRGEDCTGDLLLGEESLDRFLAGRPEATSPEHYPTLAAASAQSQPGSSAGGEQPKFAAFSEGRHVLVKFTAGDRSDLSQRWRDLLWCEQAALGSLRQAGFKAARARCLDVAEQRFLEVERFDRVGARGRQPVLSLGAIDDEYFGHRDSWSKAARRMAEAGHLSPEEGRRLRWLDVFGGLIGNTDRHFGNITLFAYAPHHYRLAPVYDMLPMFLAPASGQLVERAFNPPPPTSETLEVWHEAAHWAVSYWEQIAQSPEVSDLFRNIASSCAESVKRLGETVPALRRPSN